MRVAVLAAAAISFVATVPVSARDDTAWPSGPPKEFKTPQDCKDQGNWMVKKTLDAIACMPKDDNQIFSLVGDIYDKGAEFIKHCIQVKCAEKWHRDCPGSPGKHFRPGAVSKQFHSPASETRIRFDEVSKQFQSPANERRTTPDRKKGPKQGSSPNTGEPAPRGPLKPCGTRSNPCKSAAGGSSGSAMDRLGGSGSAGAPSGGGQRGAPSAAKSSAGGSASSATPAGGSAAPNIGINAISKPGVSMPNQSQSPGLR
jgi:hypothetical protein